MANYTVKGNKIIADIEKLTDKEMKTLSKYVALGFTIETKEKVKIERMKEQFILDYLKENDPEAKKIYDEVYNKIAVDEDGNEKTTSLGNPILQGFNAGRFWFCKNYPKNIEEVKQTIEEEGKTEELEDAYQDYKDTKDKEKKNNGKKKNKKTKKVEAMTKDEYTRVFYWKHIENR